MNSINLDSVINYTFSFSQSNPPAFSYPYQMGWPEVKVNRSDLPILGSYYIKPHDKPFDQYNETNVKFVDYTDQQKSKLYLAYNMTNTMLYGTASNSRNYLNYNPSELKTISGIVTKNGTPSPYAEVRFHNKMDGVIIKRVRANADGTFTIPDFFPQYTYYVVAFDDKGEMNAVALSQVNT